MIRRMLVFAVGLSIALGSETTLTAGVADDLKDVLLQNSEKCLSNTLELMPHENFHPANINLEVSPQKTARSTTHHYETSWGSYDKEIVSEKSMVVKVRKVGELPPAALEFFWLFKNPGDKSTRLQRCSPEFLIDGRKEAHFSIETTQSDTKYATLGIRERDGEKVIGWMARCVGLADGRVLGVKASSQDLDKLGRAGTILDRAD